MPATRRLTAVTAASALVAGLVSVPLAASAAPEGPIVITEFKYGDDEFVELTNIGDEPVDMTGWSSSDSETPAGTFDLSGFGTVAVGESVVLTEITAVAFRAAWDLDGWVKVVGGSSPGLGRGDAIRIYDAADTLVDSLAYNDEGADPHKGPRTNTDSAWLPEAAYGLDTASEAVLSSVGDAEGSWQSTGQGIGSPGFNSVGTGLGWVGGGDGPYVPEVGDVVINEVESNGDDTDWVELYNTTEHEIDLSGYWMTDDHEFADPENPAYELPADAVLAPYGFYVVDQEHGSEEGFAFGLGNPDEVTIWTPDQETELASYGYASHAVKSYGRFPDGTGPFIDTYLTSKGGPNVGSPIRLNEVNSQGSPYDFIELYNLDDAAVDLEGYVLKDDDDSHSYTFPEGASIDAGGVVVAWVGNESAPEGGFGLGSGDTARVFDDEGTLLDSLNYVGHANSQSRVPDGIGAWEATSPTPGELNFATPLETLPWPGGPDVVAIDEENAFPGDASGLDFEVGATSADDAIWLVRNKLGALYRLTGDGGDWATAETWTLQYPGGVGEPDTEGLSLAGDTPEDGVYLATERDNANNGVSRPAVLRYELPAGGAPGSPVAVAATTEWNLAPDFPGIGANSGLEGITFLPDDYLVDGGFIDPTTSEPYDPADYPLHGEGLWAVAVEATHDAYVYLLNSDGSFLQLQEIVSGLGVTADLQFDPERGSVWLVADEVDADRHAEAQIIDGAFEVVAIYERPANAAVIANEGFAVAPQSYCVDGLKPVWWADDANTDDHALREGTIECEALPGSGPNPVDTLPTRIAGADRYATSAAIVGEFDELFDPSVVFVATGENYPDALAAAAAAAHLGAPVILTEKYSLPSVVKARLNAIQPDRIYVLGSSATISNSVLNALKTVTGSPTVVRLAGADRYATMREIVKTVFGVNGNGDGAENVNMHTVVIATGRNFPDALSAGSAAASVDGAVILVDGSKGSIPTATLNLIKDLEPQRIVIAGATSAVKAGIESQLRSAFGSGKVTRVQGADRYATSIALNRAFFTDADVVFVATGAKFPDALSAAPLAGMLGSPLIVTRKSCISSDGKQYVQSLTPLRTVLLGSTASLSNALFSLKTC